MAGPNLEINVGADVAAAIRGVKSLADASVGLGNAFDIVSKQAISTGQAMNRLAPAIKPVLFNLKVIPPAANQASAAMDKLRRSSGQGSAALTDFSRIVQDAPFGIIGIGNNITQLADSFGNLRRQTGSTGGAFKALLSSAGGFGGIGLAISAITTALTFAAVGFSAWTRGLNGSKKEADEATKAYNDLIKSLKGAEDVVTEATGSVQGQVQQLQILANAVRDTSSSEEQRGRALDKLKQINKEYFGDLKLTESGLSSLTTKVREYTEAITQQAVVQSLVSEIGRIGGEYLKQRNAVEILRASIKQFAADKGLERQFDANGRAIFDFTDKNKIAFGQLRKMSAELAAQEEKLKPLRLEYTTLGNTLEDAQKQLLRFDLTKSTEKQKKETDALKLRIDALKELRDTQGLVTAQQRELVQLEVQLLRRDGVKLGFKPEEIEQQVQELIRNTRFGREPDGSIVAPIPIKIRPTIDVAGATGSDVIPPGAFDPVIEAAQKGAAAAQDRLGESLRQGFLDVVANSIANGITSAADVLGQSLGDIFSGNIAEGLAGAAEGLLGIVGSVLQEIGKQIIATSALVASLKRALDGLFGPGGEFIAAGVGLALVALGGVLRNIKFDVPGFAGGVQGFSGGLAMVGEIGPELVRLPTGSDVIPNNRVGDYLGGNITLLPSIRFSGSQFQIMLERVDKSRNQLG